MLTLARRLNEEIELQLPDGRTISVLLRKIKGNQAWLSFDAPQDVKIVRTELLEVEEYD